MSEKLDKILIHLQTPNEEVLFVSRGAVSDEFFNAMMRFQYGTEEESEQGFKEMVGSAYKTVPQTIRIEAIAWVGSNSDIDKDKAERARSSHKKLIENDKRSVFIGDYLHGSYNSSTFVHPEFRVLIETGVEHIPERSAHIITVAGNPESVKQRISGALSVAPNVYQPFKAAREYLVDLSKYYSTPKISSISELEKFLKENGN